ncbi:hypothetical protein BGZ75_002081, partial [Mortierella antarctica]
MPKSTSKTTRQTRSKKAATKSAKVTERTSPAAATIEAGTQVGANPNLVADAKATADAGEAIPVSPDKSNSERETSALPAMVMAGAAVMRSSSENESSDSDNDHYNFSDTDSEMDDGDAQEAIMLAKAAELHLGNTSAMDIDPTAKQQASAPAVYMTNQDLLNSMYAKRERLLHRMANALRLQLLPGHTAKAANTKTYEEAQHLLDELESQIKQCERVFGRLVDLPGQRLSLDKLRQSPNVGNDQPRDN